MKAAASRGIAVIPDGGEVMALERLPIAALDISVESLETFSLWGIRTLGELGALPEVDLIARLGQQAREWRLAALGALPHHFEPIVPEFALKEFFGFETPVEEIDSLLFIGARMIDGLVSRAADRALALARLTVEMQLEGGARHSLALRPAVPSSDRKFLLKLLQLELAAHPPQAAVLSMEFTADAAPSSVVQLGLFTPQTPEPSRLDVTLARLKAIVGEDRVGAPVLMDSNRPASFQMQTFSVDRKCTPSEDVCPRLALRRMRPPVPVRVSLRGVEPAAFFSRDNHYRLTAAYGPWRTSGCWWSVDEWDVEEWDVLAVHEDGTSMTCLLVRDLANNEWQLEAVYD
jgi:protein ImuB